MTRDERHIWLFAGKDGHTINFTQEGMPFRVMKPNAVFGGVVHINDTKCRIRIVHRQDAENGKRYEVRFPDAEWKLEPDKDGTLRWTDKLTIEETTLVGYMEIKGNWKAGDGKCLFHPIGNQGEEGH